MTVEAENLKTLAVPFVDICSPSIYHALDRNNFLDGIIRLATDPMARFVRVTSLQANCWAVQGRLCRARSRLISIASLASAVPRIEIVASDVDGTLLNSRQKLTRGVEEAVNRASDLGVQVRTLTVPGKTLPKNTID
jgi:hypothetical protein